MSYDKPLNTIIVNLILDRLPDEMKDLYASFCYDNTYHTYRITISRIIVRELIVTEVIQLYRITYG